MQELASRLLDIAADYDFIKDFNIEIHEDAVLESRIELEKGFVDIYRNFQTGKTAYAWVVDGERIFGADNTGGWHIHPLQKPEEHQGSDRISLEEFFLRVSEKI
ncbi:MAG: hypothetical protein ABEI53_02445 [Candidatus Magasanikbacteria bacterium]